MNLRLTIFTKMILLLLYQSAVQSSCRCNKKLTNPTFQLQSDWAQMQVIELRNDGAGFGFGISGSRNSGAVVRNIFPGGAADRV